jgi:selenocysteine lyase/cysteine desulfurase
LSYPAAAAAAAAVVPGLTPRSLDILAGLAEVRAPVSEPVSDERFWFEVQQAFTVDRTLVNLNHGGVSPSPAIVQEAMRRHLDASNTAPAYVMWQILEPRKETVRAELARSFGCDSEEMAITRNASESLQICQLGFDLRRGDEVLTTNQDYPRMIETWKQRERRDGIVLRQFSIPVPAENPAEIVSRFESNLSPRTRLILICHVINLTGQILPVRDVVRMARERGIPVLVDGAHAFANLVFSRDELECDYYAVSLHKWLMAPHGTGFLYVRKDRIGPLWPMQAAPPEMDTNIRKFEEIGTHPAANILAISEALTFHHGIGARRKEARLRHLRDYWARRLLAASDRVRLHTSLNPAFATGIGTVQIEGVSTVALNEHLWSKHRIFTTAIEHPDFEGLRISPGVATTLEELDRFCEAVERVAKNGLPAA